MQSKTSYFSRTIFLSQLKRFWPLYASYFVIWALIVPIPLSSALRDAGIYGGDMAGTAMQHIMNTGLYGGALMTVIFSAFFAMAAFYYLYNNRSVSQMCSLPVKRGGVFLSVYLPGLFVMLATNLVILLLSLAITLFYGVAVAWCAFQAFAMISLMTLFFYGFASFCAMLTGHILVLPVIYALLNVGVVSAAALAYAILEKFVYGLVLGSFFETILLLFSPVVCILGRTNLVQHYDEAEIYYSITGYSYDSWGYLIAIAIAGIAFTALAIVLLRRRRMESAGDVVALSPLKPVFKYCLSFGCALVAGTGLFFLIFPERYYSVGAGISDTITVLIFMIIGAFVGYFAAEMLIQKTLRVFSAQKWKGLLAVMLILCALTAVSEFDVLGFERRVPSPEDVQSVQIYGYSSPVTIKDQEDIRAVMEIHRRLVENKYLHEGSSYNSYYPSIYIEYRMNDGSFMLRRYYVNIDATEDCDAIEAFLNTPRMILLRNDPGVSVSPKTIYEANVTKYNPEYGYYEGETLTPEEAYELYTECIVPDMEDGTIGLASYSWQGEDYNDYFMALDIYFNLNELMPNGEYSYGSMSFTPTIDSVRTNKWLTDHGFELMTFSEANATNYYQ